MCTPMVVDANCIAEFQKERIQEIEGHATRALDHIFSNGWIVACPKCIQTWSSCAEGAGALALSDWVADKMSSREIRPVEQVTNTPLMKNLRKLGLPKEDIKWLQVAERHNAYGLVTEDTDLFDPKSKNSKNALQVRQERSGSVAKFARKQLNVEIMTLRHVPSLVPLCDL